MRLRLIFKSGAEAEVEVESWSQYAAGYKWTSLERTYPKLVQLDASELVCVLRLTK